jgi:hypothetical protein
MMNEIRVLVRCIALDRAYQIADRQSPDGTCRVCGNPGQRWACCGPKMPFVCCDQCVPPEAWASGREIEWCDHPSRKAIAKLMSVTQEEAGPRSWGNDDHR